MFRASFLSAEPLSRRILSLSSRSFHSQRPLTMQFTDIGSNLGDPIFRGNHRGKQVHPDDLTSVISRAREAGVTRQILTGDCLNEAKKIIQLAQEHSPGLFTTIGCHPCRSNEVEQHQGGLEGYMKGLEDIITSQSGGPRGYGPIVAIGECGLDYDRLFLSEKDAQLKVFPPHLQLAAKFDLPLFLHMRTTESHKDFIRIIKEYGRLTRGGVVHSFTGTLEEAKDYIDLGLDIGINGCSLKTQENLDVVKYIPLSNIHLESDCPWCEIRPSHASFAHISSIPSPSPYRPEQVKKERWSKEKMIKGRNEPSSAALVAHVIASLKEISLEELSRITWENSSRLFGIGGNHS